MKIQPENIKNIIVFRNDRFGEFLLNIPAFRALKETFFNARLIIAVDPVVKELAQAVPYADEVIEYSKEKHKFCAQLRLAKELRSRKIDMAVVLNPTKEAHLISFLAGIPIRAGYNRKWGFLLTHKVIDKKYLGEKHEVQYNLELAGLVGARTNDASLCLRIDSPEAGKNTNLVAIHPWTSDPIKQWPIENFVELARMLAGLNYQVVIIGGKEELAKGNNEFDHLGDNIENLTGRTSLKELAVFLRKCKLLISADSGPVHLASAVGTLSIAIFRNDLAGKTAKRWGPWLGGSIVIEKENLSLVSVEEVLNKAKEVLKR